MYYVTADQLIDLLLTMVALCFCTAVVAVMLGQWFHGIAREVARWFEKRGKPPNPVMMRLVAKNLRMRAAQLEIKAERALNQAHMPK